MYLIDRTGGSMVGLRVGGGNLVGWRGVGTVRAVSWEGLGAGLGFGISVHRVALCRGGRLTCNVLHRVFVPHVLSRRRSVVQLFCVTKVWREFCLS